MDPLSLQASQSLHAFHPDFFRKNILELTDTLHRYLTESMQGGGKVLVQNSMDEILRQLNWANIVNDGGAELSHLAEILLANSNHLQNPAYMGHQVAVPMLSSTMADLIHGVTNNAMAVYEMGPAGTAVEKGVLRWMLGKVGWEKGGAGVMTHGGSLANLTCLLAARARTLPESWEEGTGMGGALLVSEAAHYSITRSASILGLGAKSVHRIPVDGNLRIKMEELQRIQEGLAEKGEPIVAVIASAGVTATGSFDPLRRIGEFCRRKGLWLHVDGAHGASFLLSPKYRGLLDGLELADSLTWDTHKMLGTSSLCGVALFREAGNLERTFSQNASYLFAEEERPGEDISRNTLECTKALLSLKLFFNLAAVGEQGLREHVERLVDNTHAFHALISGREGFHCLTPQANILCFRYGKDSQLQDRIRERLVREGDFYITRATVQGESYLRLVIMNPFTAGEHVAALCDRVETYART